MSFQLPYDLIIASNHLIIPLRLWPGAHYQWSLPSQSRLDTPKSFQENHRIPNFLRISVRFFTTIKQTGNKKLPSTLLIDHKAHPGNQGQSFLDNEMSIDKRRCGWCGSEEVNHHLDWLLIPDGGIQVHASANVLLDLSYTLSCWYLEQIKINCGLSVHWTSNGV